ncbi:MAG: galactokinase [Acidobacteriaceae bacterium]
MSTEHSVSGEGEALQPVDVTALLAEHRQRFGAEGRAFQAPGRVNLIGEHTDYSGGLVMPAAIDFHTVAAISGRSDGHSVLHSSNFREEVRFPADHLPQSPQHRWSDYPLGVAWSLHERGVSMPGWSISILGNVPLGAGLSSSASIEVAVALALLSLSATTMPRKEIALACQRAENGFVGAQSGIMDQYIACCGQRDHALMIDCRSLESTPVPLPENVRLVICNSMVKHAHAGGEYNQRRAEVEEGTRILRTHNAALVQLRDATLADLAACRADMPEPVYRRCRHIITENARVQQAAQALSAGDLERVGVLMHEAHVSYRDDFEASCPEADTLVDLARQQPGLIGARLTGGCFGGCTVNLVEAEHAAAFRQHMRTAYKQATDIDAEIYLSRAADGAHAIP